jgi:hypothetical protein
VSLDFGFFFFLLVWNLSEKEERPMLFVGERKKKEGMEEKTKQDHKLNNFSRKNETAK